MRLQMLALLAALGGARGFRTGVASARALAPRGERTLLSAKGFGAADAQGVEVLNVMAGWSCIRGCGACCYLVPDERPELADVLSPEELRGYREMVAEDGWCKHFDKVSKTCLVYEDRPSYCRVSVEGFEERYGVPEDEFAEACAEGCRDHIATTFGERSEIMVRFDTAQETEELILVTSPRDAP